MSFVQHKPQPKPLYSSIPVNFNDELWFRDFVQSIENGTAEPFILNYVGDAADRDHSRTARVR
jgi:hypothetical protein